MYAVKTHRLEAISQTDFDQFSFICYRLTISFSTHAQGERKWERQKKERERERERERNRERMERERKSQR